MIANPVATPANLRCNLWLTGLLSQRLRVCVPEIADFEGRRELLRAGRTVSVAQLDCLTGILDDLPLTTDTMRQAAVFLAAARRQGRPTADPHALDGDVILAAQAALLARAGDRPVIATTNVGHLGGVADARLWTDIA